MIYSPSRIRTTKNCRPAFDLQLEKYGHLSKSDRKAFSFTMPTDLIKSFSIKIAHFF